MLSSRCLRAAVLPPSCCQVFNSAKMASPESVLNLFATSRVLIGMHGGAMANLGMAPPGRGTTVIEMTYEGGRSFEALAQAMGHDYHKVIVGCGQSSCDPDASTSLDTGVLSTELASALQRIQNECHS